MYISSVANQRIKNYRKLSLRKERNKTGLFLVEGIRLVVEAVEKKVNIEALIVAPDLLYSEVALGSVEKFRETGGFIIEVSEAVFASLAKKEHPQGILAVIHQRWSELSDVSEEKKQNWVVLDTIRDPGNLGTILRTLDGVGGAGVILLDDCCDPYDATATRASMGSIFSQKIIKTNFSEFSKWLYESNIPLIGTSDHDGRVHYREYAYSNPTLLMMGSERAGLPDSHIGLCDGMVMIPMEGNCDSLNLSVATGVILYEIHHQQSLVEVGE